MLNQLKNSDIFKTMGSIVAVTLWQYGIVKMVSNISFLLTLDQILA